MGYRGDGEASDERLAALDAEIAALEAKLAPIFWERVAHVWGVRRELDVTLSPLAARHDRIARLGDAIARAEEGPAAEPFLPPLPDPPSGVIASFDRAAFVAPKHEMERVHEGVRRRAPEALEMIVRAAGVWGTRFLVDDVPIDLCLAREGTGQSVHWVLRAETTIAPAAKLSLKPEGILQDLLEMIGLRREIELGDPRFDPAFVIGGDESSAAAYLTQAARTRLLAIGEHASPTATLGAGRARLAVGTSNPRAVTRVLDLLIGWHATPSPEPLLA